MTEAPPATVSLLEFLGIERIQRGSEDVLALTLPLMDQVLEVHEQGKTAPLEGVDEVMFTAGRLWFERAKARPARLAEAQLQRLQASHSQAFDVAGHYKRVEDDEGSSTTDRRVLEPGEPIERPSYLTRYLSWEHEVGHQDPLTDIFVLGLILASVALDQNLGGRDALEEFVRHRAHLAQLNSRLHPVIARAIVRMTELDRRKRAQDLRGLIAALRGYREQTVMLDEPVASSVAAGSLAARRHTYGRLRDRLVDFSRKNRLLHFQPSAQTVNLTLGSVPLVLSVESISPDSLCTWRGRAVADIVSNKPVPLGRYLRFEDYPFLSSSLDQLRLDANRTRTELGFSPLRLVACFLHWHNLKEAKEVRITSPLLLLPVTLEKKKGVRDAVFLTAQAERAEVNPVLRQYLQQLYGVRLPEQVDLAEPSAIEALGADLLTQLQASEPGITLTTVDKPRIDMILAQAKRRLETYRKRVALSGRHARSHRGFDYSYARSKFQPLGVQMFAHLVYPSEAPNRELHEDPRPRIFGHSPNVVEKSMYSIKQGGTEGGPYEWALDLCSVTLANFNYRKMSLVRDYAALSESDAAQPTFDALFSTDARPVLDEPPPIPIEERFDVMPADPTQASAVARARRGESFIIQGPPGTGKSQTITNLIADYVARGKRVLFVCEKRAAIDVVYHRMRMQGLAPLTCLIHDSQTDKKSFIKDLKETYESWIAQAPEQVLDDERRQRAADFGSILGRATRFRAAMQACPKGSDLPIVSLLGRALDLADVAASAVPEERLPNHRQFVAGAGIVRALEQGLRAAGREGLFARHPLSVLADEILFSDSPTSSARGEARALLTMLDQLRDSQLVRAREVESVGGLLARVELVRTLRPLITEKALHLLDVTGQARRDFERVMSGIRDKLALASKTAAAAAGWRQVIPAEDTKTALVLARRFEGSLLYRVFGWLSPSWWRLRKLLNSSFDFASRSLRPSWCEILEKLSAKYDAELAVADAKVGAQRELEITELDAIEQALASVPEDGAELGPFKSWLLTPGARDDGPALLRVADGARELQTRLGRLLRAPDGRSWESLRQRIEQLDASLSDLDAFLEPLRKLSAPEHTQLAALIREYPVSADQLEREVCRAEANAGLRERALDVLAGVDWDALRDQAIHTGTELRRANADAVVERTRNAFLAKVRLSSAPADSLNKEQKKQKKEYAAGRKELEHEFGKVTRYRSIRELAAGNPGVVVRDLKPVWLMSPLSVADTLPLEASFDIVIFDEASQIPLEDAVPAACRGAQVIVVGDQMQLPPTDFFSSSRSASEEADEPEQSGYELDAHSLLSHAERALPSTMLGWHYRSRDEALITFSNRVFYDGRLLTVPSVARTATFPPIVARSVKDGERGASALLERAISYHRVEDSPYEQRRNTGEARYIAELLRGLLRQNTGKTLGVVAFSEAQQGEIEDALRSLADEDPEFGARYETEMDREEDGQHVGLFVKNLENVQGDERDIIIISVCYGPDASGRMLMNFGPINKTGGEKRLNVIFSRAKHHVAVVSSIRWNAITNDYNDGASCLRNYLRYAEAMSTGALAEAAVALQSYAGHETVQGARSAGSLDERIARALRQRGHEVEVGVGTSQFRCNLGVRSRSGTNYALGILLDDPTHQKRSVDELLEAQPSVLKNFGWNTITVLHKDWYADPELVLKRIEAMLAH